MCLILMNLTLFAQRISTYGPKTFSSRRLTTLMEHVLVHPIFEHKYFSSSLLDLVIIHVTEDFA